MYQPGSHKRKVTQDLSSTFLLRCMPLFFLARRIQPLFVSLADREVELVYHRFNRSPLVGHFIFYFFVGKNPSYRDSNSRPNVSEGFEVTN